MTSNTLTSFQAMLNQYLPNELLKEELIQRDYIIQTANRDDQWKGGPLIVPFKGAGASSVAFGQLTSSNDIAQSQYVRGQITNYQEVWGSLIFNQADLMEHDGKIPESTFLRLLPDELEDFMDYVKEVTSVQLGSGPQFATLTANGDTDGTGLITVDHIDRFNIGQKVVLASSAAGPTVYYVTAININTNDVTLSATRGGPVTATSQFTTAQTAKVYHDGVYDASGNFTTFISMRQALLSAANGGSATLHGQTKTNWPILQAVNINGSSITSVNILDKLYDAFTQVRKIGKGRATEYLMDLTNLGSCMKQLELNKGAFRVVEEPKESLYGWLEMKIANVTGQIIKLVGIQEMDTDIIPLVDWRSITFRTNGFFRKRISPDGREYFEVRNTNGYQYIVDVCLFGEMEYKKPGHSAIINAISYT
jgi:hypothetical protein